MKLHQINSWGIDVGNVIFHNLSESLQLFHQKEDSSPEEIVEQMSLIPDTLNGLKMLVGKVGKDNIWLFSKSGEKRIATTKLALERFKVYQSTGIKEDQVIFVPGRQDKIPIIKALELDGHIDDRGETIFSVQKFVKCPLWFCPNQKDADKWARKMKHSVRVVSGWKQLMEIYK